MKQHVTMILGEPCTGKSSLMRAMIETHDPLCRGWTYHDVKWVPHHRHEARGSIILGRYDEEHQFPGTDRLSMAVQPHAIEFIREHRDWNIIFEGDRLGNAKMIEALRSDSSIDLLVLQLTVGDKRLKRRRDHERTQSDEFVRGRRTKLLNIHRDCQPIHLWAMLDYDDQAALIKRLLKSERI